MNHRIGLLASLLADGPSLGGVADLGLSVCQLVCWKPGIYSPELAAQVRRAAVENAIGITSLWAGWSGPAVWDLLDGPGTLGLAPHEHRDARVAALKQAGDFAQQAGLPAVVTHLGFIPEQPREPLFEEMVVAVRDVALYLQERGIEFWFETGQETPITLLRLMQQVGTNNLGINLDPANLILYGKANPVDALDVFGAYVRSVHAKDAFYPTDPMRLGREVPVGEGRVRFPDLVRRLAEIGYDGAFIIEREISGPQQEKDIRHAAAYLDRLLG